MLTPDLCVCILFNFLNLILLILKTVMGLLIVFYFYFLSILF